LALSLGISGDRTGAFAMLQPLLQRQDPAAQRIRAFVLALVGDERAASSAIDVAMPGSGGGMAGYFRLLPSLTAPQKAAAVHLGVFPDPSQIRVAAVSPRIVAPPVADNRSRRAAPLRTASPVSRLVSGPPAPVVPAPSITAAPTNPAPTVAVAAQPDPVRLTASATTSVGGPAQPGFAAAPPASDAGGFSLPSERAAPSAAPPAPGDRLSGIDRLLAQADELPIPPAPQPRFETTAEKPAPERDRAGEVRKLADARKAAEAKKASARKVAEAKKLAESKKLADAKKTAEAQKLADEKREREAIGVAGTHWVQLAGGANADRMGTEFRRLAAKSSALRKKGGAVTSGKDYFRLLTGPFASKSEAQAFVNQLAKDDVDGFSWTRTPAGIRIEKIAPR
jgi:hypothetical protein